MSSLECTRNTLEAPIYICLVKIITLLHAVQRFVAELKKQNRKKVTVLRSSGTEPDMREPRSPRHQCAQGCLHLCTQLLMSAAGNAAEMQAVTACGAFTRTNRSPAFWLAKQPYLSLGCQWKALEGCAVKGVRVKGGLVLCDAHASHVYHVRRSSGSVSVPMPLA